jgi:adenylate cyclase
MMPAEAKPLSASRAALVRHRAPLWFGIARRSGSASRAILAADVAGYSRLMGVDEAGTLARMRTLQDEIVNPGVAAHRGRIVKLMGDGVLVEFASVVDAVSCAVAVQEAMAAHNIEIPDDERISYRIGVNLGDIMVEDGDIYGDGVNVAARLKGLAEPGGICISRAARDQVLDKLELSFDDLWDQSFKNIARPVHTFRVRLAGDPAPDDPRPGRGPRTSHRSSCSHSST